MKLVKGENYVNPLEVEPNNVQRKESHCGTYTLDLDSPHGGCETCGHTKSEHC